MHNSEILKRYILFILGLFISAFGVALATKANLGTSPGSSLPYVLSLDLPLTMGTLSIVINIFFVLIQIILLRRDFKPIQFVQILLALFFGLFIDVSLFIISSLLVTTYIMQWVIVMLSVVVLALGISMLVTANIFLMCGESLVLVVSKLLRKSFEKLKVFFDVALVLIAIISSFCLFGELDGIREGTIASAILVGVFVKLFNKMLKSFENKFIKQRTINRS